MSESEVKCLNYDEIDTATAEEIIGTEDVSTEPLCAMFFGIRGQNRYSRVIMRRGTKDELLQDCIKASGVWMLHNIGKYGDAEDFRGMYIVHGVARGKNEQNQEGIERHWQIQRCKQRNPDEVRVFREEYLTCWRQLATEKTIQTRSVNIFTNNSSESEDSRFEFWRVDDTA